MSWLHPTYLWALMALPVAIACFLWAAYRRRVIRERLGSTELIEALMDTVRPGRRIWRNVLLALALLLFGVALAGPRLGTGTREVERRGVDVMFVLDVSQSMQAQDIQPSRLQRAKLEIKQLLGELRGDRVGLTLFAGEAFLQCPLTTDYSAFRLYLDHAESSSIPVQGTNLEAALSTAARGLRQSDSPSSNEEDRSRVIVVISDGENHQGDPNEVRNQFDEQTTVLYTIGVGSTAGAPIPLYNDNGEQIGYKTNAAGERVETKLVEDELHALAQNDRYFRLTEQGGLAGYLPSSLSSLKEGVFASEQVESYREYYQWPLGVALLFLGLVPLIRVYRPT